MIQSVDSMRVFPATRVAGQWARFVTLSLFLVAVAFNSRAQVVLDGKLGPSGALSGPNYNIASGLGRLRENNLFHSFSQFSLASGETAMFSGPANVQNILARVTGGSRSSIDGTIRSDIAGANLFLINPNGIIFGPNASVDVSGAFAASTANYLKLADGARFVASLDADDSGLSSAPVSAFGFLGTAVADITVQQSTLAVAQGQTITLAGGDIALDGGTVKSEGGQVNLVSVRSAGEVPVDPGMLSRAEFVSVFPQQGQIRVENGGRVDASGEGGGRVVIRGGKLVVENSKVESNTTGAGTGQGIDIAVGDGLEVLNGAQINANSPTGEGAGGNITINAAFVRLNGGGLVDENFVPATQISTSTGDLFAGGGPGAGGDITMNVGRLEVANSAQITSASFGAGHAGNVTVNARTIKLDAIDPFAFTIAQISANTYANEGGGDAGDIIIRTSSLELLNAATLFATSFGNGEAGRIDIEADTLDFRTGSIVTAATFGAGNGGTVKVVADRIRFDGADPATGEPTFLTGIQAVTTSLESPAPGGNIQITADTIELANMGTIFTTSYGVGTGGNVEINARDVKLSNGGTIRSEGLDFGPAGNIVVNADRNVVLKGNSSISTSAPFSSGGDIRVTAGSEVRLFNSSITAQAGPGGGGNIEVMGAVLGYLLNSTLSAEAEGDGGNLTIDPSFFVLNKSSLISRSSTANGGNISILANYFFQSDSTIDASAPFGLPGTVSVTAPELDLSGSLVDLPGGLLDIQNLLRPDCRVRLAGDISTFIMLGRGGLPIEPGGFVPSSNP